MPRARFTPQSLQKQLRLTQWHAAHLKLRELQIQNEARRTGDFELDVLLERAKRTVAQSAEAAEARDD